MTKYLFSVGIPIEIDADDVDTAFAEARKTFFTDIHTYRMDEVSVDLVEELESDNDWAYGSHYNSLGEFNPRLVACDLCGLYAEPEEMTAGKTDFITVSLCPVCGVKNA